MTPEKGDVTAEQVKAWADDLRAKLKTNYAFTSAAYLQVTYLRNMLRQTFITSRGWTKTRVYFDGPQLARGVLRNSRSYNGPYPPYSDHSERYRIGRRPVAIIEQPYAVTEDKIREMRDWAAYHGLIFSTPDFPSWWYPEETTLCVFERR
jgi:hypothetical protein